MIDGWVGRRAGGRAAGAVVDRGLLSREGCFILILSFFDSHFLCALLLFPIFPLWVCICVCECAQKYSANYRHRSTTMRASVYLIVV